MTVMHEHYICTNTLLIHEEKCVYNMQSIRIFSFNSPEESYNRFSTEKDFSLAREIVSDLNLVTFRCEPVKMII